MKHGILMNAPIHIYIINLRMSVERKEEMIRKMDAFGLSYEFFEAVYGKELPTEFIRQVKSQPYSFYKAFGREMTLGEIGCAMSHLELYKKIVNDKRPFALILEDDIDMDENLPFLLANEKTRAALQHHLDLILLGYSADGINYKKQAEVSIYGKLKLSAQLFLGIPTVWYWSTIGYLISLEGANKLLKQGELPRMPADFLTANSPKYKVKLGVINKPLVWPGHLDKLSEIGGGRRQDAAIQPRQQMLQPKKSLTEKLKQLYRISRTLYHKASKILYKKWVKLYPSKYLFISDKF